ncbi:hypothetical protein [Enemella evansiae]|uniref:hypothetical protein n=1 Tax=Enemella evansiae TaxID=2016499 RepID=UPI0011807EFC|nr:hypothetical protein [Enemella evansiae]
MSPTNLHPAPARRSPTVRSARAISLVAGIIVVASPVLGWLGHTDYARTFYGILIGTFVGLMVGVFGPGAATSLTGLIGASIRPLLVLVALALLAWAVIGVIGGQDVLNKTISLVAASIMVAAWVPITRLSGR